VYLDEERHPPFPRAGNRDGRGAMSDHHGDAEFDAFYQSSWGRLFGQAYVLTGNRELAQDLTQEALLRAWKQWTKVAGYESPEGWTRRVLHHLCIES
jgi:DNA-directed RNA polymerase specialized sigma24 family protein